MSTGLVAKPQQSTTTIISPVKLDGCFWSKTSAELTITCLDGIPQQGISFTYS